MGKKSNPYKQKNHISKSCFLNQNNSFNFNFKNHMIEINLNDFQPDSSQLLKEKFINHYVITNLEK